MINSVNLVGRLATDVELKYTPTGTALCNLRLAVQDGFRKGEDGKPLSYFFDVVVWGKSAEFAAKYLEKGNTAGVTGRLQEERWTSPEGQKRSKVVIHANDISGIGNKGGAAADPPAAPAPKPAPPPAEEECYDPFAGEDV